MRQKWALGFFNSDLNSDPALHQNPDPDEVLDLDPRKKNCCHNLFQIILK
jgi:hypothetical protein